MITRRTKIQLLIFVLITVIGVGYVGTRYAQLDKLIYNDDYTVVVHLADSGGLFAGGEVTYRGVQIGRVDKLVLTQDGVDAHLDIEHKYDKIPADTLAVVGNRSAVGEQYIELQPKTDDKPYLTDGSQIDQPDTETPIPTQKLLGDISTTVESVDKKSLSTAIDSLGQAFAGTGQDLQRLLDSGTSFIKTANDNFELTTDLIRDSNTVLSTQADQESAIRTFASQLSAFSTTLAGADPDVRRLLDNGSVAANQLRTFLEDNQVELGDLINNLTTTGKVIVENIPGVEQILVLYPYVVEGAFSVVSKSPDTGLYDAHFGLIITSNPVCHQGYESTDRRPPQNGGNRPMNTKAGCTEPIGKSNARGEQNLITRPRAAADYDAPVVASYDPTTGKLHWGDPSDSAKTAGLTSPGSVAPASLGEDSWKWLFLQPLTASTAQR